MKLEIGKEWCIRMAQLEGDAEIGAGRLRLEDVRELLQLDRVFYTADDPGIVRETVSRIRIAGIQVYKRPKLLIDAIRKSSLMALYLPDRKRILLDEALPKLKHRCCVH